MTIASHVHFDGLEQTPISGASLGQIQSLKQRSQNAQSASALFFYGFDRDKLVFVLARRVEPPPASPPVKRAQTWIATDRYVLERDARALKTLGLTDEIRQYEAGICGIQIGMDAASVRTKLGEPDDIMVPAAAGCVQHRYDKLYIYMCFDKVREVSPPEGGRCP